jgi:4a-hydroxytetrahydrobiopterin dehydratase
MQILTSPEIAALTAENPRWNLLDGKLVAQWTFPDFPAAIAFVNRVAAIAEAAGHHPDIDIRYNRVQLALVTHDAGGITHHDANMAKRLAQEFSS